MLFRYAVAGLCLLCCFSSNAQSTEGKPYFSDPALSPDASEIAFVSGGDIWTVPSKGGDARLLVSHPDYESRPVYSPDGRFLAFASTRTGGGDIYVLNIAAGSLRRITWDDTPDELSAWSADGKWIYFSTGGRDIAAMRDVYRVRPDGGTPMPVSSNLYVSEFFAAPSPDGKTIALSAHGVASQQWWRNGSSHLDQSEIWLQPEGSTNYRKLTEGGAKELWPLWSPDGKTVYYISDKSGTQNLYERPISGGTAKQLTQFTTGRVLWPSIAGNGKAIVFERDFQIWLYDVASGKAAPVAILRKGITASPEAQTTRQTGPFRELALSPDGKKVAFTSRGDVFVASSKEGGDAFRVTNTPAIEGGLAWAGSSNSLIYSANRDGAAHLYEYNFITSTESPLTSGALDDGTPLFSPDGKKLAFVRDGRELRVIDRATKMETLVAKGYLSRPPFSSPGGVAWSPDGKWIAFAGYGTKSLRNVYVVPAAGGEAKPVSFLANTFSGGITWSKDGKSILFSTSQRTEDALVARVDLVPQQPRFREDQFQSLFVDQQPATPAPGITQTAKPLDKAAPATDTLFKPAAKGSAGKSATPPVNIVWQGLQQRLSVLPVGVDVGDMKLSPDGNTLLLVANVAGQQNLYSWSLDELSRDAGVLKQLTTTPGNKDAIQFSQDGRDVFYLESGRIQSISVDTKAVRPLAVSAEIAIDFNKEKKEIFNQAWELQNKGFYDPAFNGADWKAVKATYEPLAAGASTPDELRRILALMVGELNASHSGVSGPPAQNLIGHTGLRFDAAEYEKNGRLKITEVISLSPAAIAGDIPVGAYVLAVDGTPISATTNFDELLQNKINRKVVLTIGTTATDGSGKKITIRPISIAAEKGLLYKQWVQQQRDYVAKASKGRLGYVHMYDMSQESLNQLYLDMDAENQSRDGVVVDIRNNNGGFVNAYALDVLSRKGYMSMTVRGLPTAPARTQLGQRALEAPTILLTNQHSLSDAEDFAEGYRTMKLGKVVGEPTGGWIIYTSNVPLFDGTTVRLPFIKVTDHEGKNMELHPRPVDIAVSNPLGNQEKDGQLDAAVTELLKEIDAGK